MRDLSNLPLDALRVLNDIFINPTKLYVTVAIAFLTTIIVIYLVVAFKRLRSKFVHHINTQTQVDKGSPILIGQTVSENVFGVTLTTPKGTMLTYIAGLQAVESLGQFKGMYIVYLPFVSGAHLVGVPKNTRSDTAALRKSFDNVHLEGNYSQYFTLFAERNQGSMTQYVLDPEAMEFTVEFCQNYEWEIIGDTLYFASPGELPSFDIVDQFIDEIRPAIATQSDASLQIPMYGYRSAANMKCPRCSGSMSNHGNMIICDKGDGYLMTGGEVVSFRLKSDSVQIVHSKDRPKDANDILQCPYCHHDMAPVQFMTINVFINICQKCMYRWVDAYEVENVTGKLPI